MVKLRSGLSFLIAAGSVAIGSATMQPASADEVFPCSAIHRDAVVIRAAHPDYPSIAEQRGDGGVVYVKVDLTPTGSISGTSIAQSSGNPFLDDAALEAAARSEFQPETQDCTPISGSYLFLVTFAQ